MSGERAPGWAELLFAIALRVHPREFRERYGAEMRALFREAWCRSPDTGARIAHLVRSVRVAAWMGLKQRVAGAGGVRGSGDARVASDVWRLDLRHAWRGLVRRPGLASLVVLTLALGVGANAAVFGTLYSVVLEPLPFDQPDRLVRLYQLDTRNESEIFGGYLTLPALLDFRDNARTLSGIGGVYTYSEQGVDLTGAGRPERLRALRAGADYLAVLGVRPARGRAFRRDEERADARVAIVSAALAERVGATATFDGETYDIVGVLPEGFEDPLMGRVDALLPLALPVRAYEEWEWDNHYLSAIARLAPGSSLEEARTELAHLSRLQGQRIPDTEHLRGVPVPLHGDVVGESDTLLTILMGAVGLLLLLTFVNVAVLLVARSLDRTHEVAVRAALGSPRSRMARQYLFEGLLLAAAGAAAGAAVAIPLQRVLVGTAPAGALDRAAVAPLWPILLFGLMAAVAAGVFFGIAPALGLRRVDATGVLRHGARGSDRRIAIRMREGLVVTQVAMALVLLTGAGVMLRSLQRMRALDLNLRTEHVLTFEANLPLVRYGDADTQRRFRDDLTRRIEAMPGVLAAGAITTLPVTGRMFTWGARRSAGDDWVPADQRVVSGNALAALGIPLLAGRTFHSADDAEAPPRVVLGEAAARTLFGGIDAAVGGTVRIGGNDREVIGVVADVPVSARGEVVPMAYHNDAQFTQSWTRNMTHLVATEPGSGPILPGIASAVAELDPDLVVHGPRNLDEIVGAGRARERFAARLLSGFAALAVGLSALGLYGILAHAVRRRRREIGIRLALGAGERSVLGLVVRRGIATAAGGVGIGLLGAWLGTRTLSALVYGVEVHDPWVFTGAALTMTLVALLASALPALRAARVDPAETFRTD